ETSGRAAVVGRYADLFTREQHEALRAAEEAAPVADRERLLRLKEACAGGIAMLELAELVDRLENETLAQRVEFHGESMPLRAAQATLAILDEYADREELGELTADASALLNERRLELLVRAEALDAELSQE